MKHADPCFIRGITRKHVSRDHTYIYLLEYYNINKHYLTISYFPWQKRYLPMSNRVAAIEKTSEQRNYVCVYCIHWNYADTHDSLFNIERNIRALIRIDSEQLRTLRIVCNPFATCHTPGCDRGPVKYMYFKMKISSVLS